MHFWAICRQALSPFEHKGILIFPQKGYFSSGEEEPLKRSEELHGATRICSLIPGALQINPRRRECLLSQDQLSEEVPGFLAIFSHPFSQSADQIVEEVEGCLVFTPSGVSPTPLDVRIGPRDVSEPVKSHFSEIFASARLRVIEIEQCVSIPELRTRPIVAFGVRKFKHMISGGSLGTVSGHIGSGIKPVVCELPSSYRNDMLQFFLDKGREKEMSEKWIDNKQMFHVVDGRHEHGGWWEYNEGVGLKFCGYSWQVIEIPWQPPEVLKAVARMAGELQKKEHPVDFTFSDEMLNLREVIDEYARRNGIVLNSRKPLPTGFVQAVVDHFSGATNYSNSTLQIITRIAAKLSTKVVRFMKQKLDEEVEGHALKNSKKTSDSISVDHRAYRKVLNSHSLRGSKCFLGPETTDEDRMNFLCRIRNIACDSGKTKGFSMDEIDEQTVRAIAARKEIEKFRRVLDTDEWPAVLNIPRRNLLETTMDDREVEENKGNDIGMLKSLKHTYVSVVGKHAATLLERYENKLQRTEAASSDASRKEGVSSACEGGSQEGSARPADLLADDGSNADRISESDIEEMVAAQRATGGSEEPSLADAEQEEENDSVLPSEEEPAPEPSVLEKCNVEVQNLSWEEYQRQILVDSGLFDFVIAEPFHSSSKLVPKFMDDDTRKRFVQFVRNVLVYGGYGVVSLPWKQVGDKSHVFEASQIDVEGPFNCLRAPECMQKSKGNKLQNPAYTNLVVKNPGRHPSGFKADLESSYSDITCSYPRRFW